MVMVVEEPKPLLLLSSPSLPIKFVFKPEDNDKPIFLYNQSCTTPSQSINSRFLYVCVAYTRVRDETFLCVQSGSNYSISTCFRCIPFFVFSDTENCFPTLREMGLQLLDKLSIFILFFLTRNFFNSKLRSMASVRGSDRSGSFRTWRSRAI